VIIILDQFNGATNDNISYEETHPALGKQVTNGAMQD